MNENTGLGLKPPHIWSHFIVSDLPSPPSLIVSLIDNYKEPEEGVLQEWNCLNKISGKSHVLCYAVRNYIHSSALDFPVLDWLVLHFCSALHRTRPDTHLVHWSAVVTPCIKACLVMYVRALNNSRNIGADSLHCWQLPDQQDIYKHKFLPSF